MIRLSLERWPSTDGMLTAMGHYHSSYSDAMVPSITSQMSKATHWPVTSSSTGYPLPALKCISTGTNTLVFKRCCQLFWFYSSWSRSDVELPLFKSLFSLMSSNFNINYLMQVKCYNFYYILCQLPYSDDNFFDKWNV